MRVSVPENQIEKCFIYFYSLKKINLVKLGDRKKMKLVKIIRILIKLTELYKKEIKKEIGKRNRKKKSEKEIGKRNQKNGREKISPHSIAFQVIFYPIFSSLLLFQQEQYGKNSRNCKDKPNARTFLFFFGGCFRNFITRCFLCFFSRARSFCWRYRNDIFLFPCN